MIKSESELITDGRQSLHLYIWKPDDEKNLRGIVQIVHGKGEYGKRYEDLAAFLTSGGFLVCACDLRGHGLTAKNKTDLGFFCEENGWKRLTDDLYAVTRFLKEEYENQKIVLFGHSMGSFLARTYIVRHQDAVDGLILSGTAHNPKPLLLFGKYLAQRDVKKGKGKSANRFLNKLSFDNLNKGFKGGKTGYEWLSRDTEIIQKYVDDELCGFDLTSSALLDMFEGLLFITDIKNISKTPKELPVLIFSGSEDPVGSKGKTVIKCYREYEKAGVKNLKIKLYPGMRHETFNEIGKEEVYMDILCWLNELGK